MAKTIPKAINHGSIKIIGHTKSLFGLVPIFKIAKDVQQERIYHADKFKPTLRDI